ncbi:hypothetical protein Tco_0475129 [Tanacetum coccineum]
METRKCLEDDKRRSKDFIIAIEKKGGLSKYFKSFGITKWFAITSDCNPCRCRGIDYLKSIHYGCARKFYISINDYSSFNKNGSLFKGGSEFEKLKIYLITLVSIRSDWEDLPWLFRSVENLNTMAEQNVPTQAPARTDEQIVPRSQWLQIGKSNLLFDAQKIQKNPIFQISVDILRNTNFFRAFSASVITLMGIVLLKDSYILLTQESHEASQKTLRRKHLLSSFYGRDDFLLGNLKFISKGETNEVFGMAIPKQLITQAIQQSLYYPKYLEMVAKNIKKTPQDSASKQPKPVTKRAPPKKPTTTTPVKPTKTPSSKQPKSPTKKPSKRKLPQKVRKGKPSFQLVDEDDEAQQESVPQEEGDDPDLKLAKKMSLDAGEGVDADIERAIKLSLDPSFLPQGRAPVGGRTYPVSTQGQAGSDPEKAHEALAGPDPEPMQEDQTGSDSGKVHVSLAGPNPEHME